MTTETLKKTRPLPSRAQAIDLLWRKGILYWKLDSAQKQIYDLYKNNTALITVIEISRRVGKSFSLCLMAIEKAIQDAESTLIYACETSIMVSKIILPIFRLILKDCPEDLRPEYKKHDKAYYFKNGSILKIEGCEDPDRLRGSACHMAIVDEAGFIKELSYLVSDILIPQFLTTNGRLVLSSTPPADLKHPFLDSFVPRAKYTKSYLMMSIDDYFALVEKDPPLFKDRINKAMILEEIERLGRNSPTVRREYFCERVVETEGTVIPEFNSELEKEIVQEWPRPPKYDFYTCMDIGSANDYTFILFAYYDFRAAKLIIEDEYMMRYEETTSKNIALTIRAKEAELFTDATGTPIQPYLRVADNNNPILLNDLAASYQIYFATTRKDEKKAAINDLRTRIGEKNIIINPKCTNLIDHIKYAQWATNGKTFKRHPDFGHYDGLDTAVYLIRNIHWDKNPYGKEAFGVNYYIPPSQRNILSKSAEAFKKMFKINRN